MDYEYYYNNAKNRYYNACSEINSCQNRIYSLNAGRQKKVNSINQLKVDIRNIQAALDGVAQVLKDEGVLKDGVTAIADKTDQAAVNFSNMVWADDTKCKNLTDVYSDEISKTKAALSGIFDALSTKNKILNNRMTELQSQLNSMEAEMQDINNQLRIEQADLQSWNNTQQSAACDMEYYRRKMQEVV